MSRGFPESSPVPLRGMSAWWAELYALEAHQVGRLDRRGHPDAMWLSKRGRQSEDRGRTHASARRRLPTAKWPTLVFPASTESARGIRWPLGNITGQTMGWSQGRPGRLPDHPGDSRHCGLHCCILGPESATPMAMGSPGGWRGAAHTVGSRPLSWRQQPCAGTHLRVGCGGHGVRALDVGQGTHLASRHTIWGTPLAHWFVWLGSLSVSCHVGWDQEP